jgi:predicted alpha-1,2-mannosidase
MFRLILVFLLGVRAAGWAAEADPLRWVDPFLGTDGDGEVFPGAVVPFGLVSLSPDTIDPQGTSGYRPGVPVQGFSHNHTSGTGGRGRYGNLLVAPQEGQFDRDAWERGMPLTREIAAPGFYAADCGGVRVELTASAKAGIHRYTFPRAGLGTIGVDFSATRNNGDLTHAPSSVCTGVDAEVVGTDGFAGQASFNGGWGGLSPYTIYFAGRFDRTFAGQGAWREGSVTGDVPRIASPRGGFFFKFPVQAGETVTLTVAISYRSRENARRNLDAALSFAETRRAAEGLWRDVLRRIQIEGGSEAERTLFYNGLYRSVIMPTDVTGETPEFDPGVPAYWNIYCLWDTSLTVHPLYTLILPERQAHFLQALLAIYERRGWLPDAWLAGDFGMVQGGTQVDLVFAEAILKKLPGFDREKAYAAMRQNATVPGNDIRWGRFEDYFLLGYVPLGSDRGRQRNLGINSNPTSRTLEYARNDFAVAEAARVLGHAEDATTFAQRSLGAWILWNPDIRFFWARDREGLWMRGHTDKEGQWIEDAFDPAAEAPSWYPPFYEGTAWHYAFAMPHDGAGLVRRHGGREELARVLDRYFDGGFHNQANEPGFLTPWMYLHAGRPDRTADRVREIRSRDYRRAPDGLPGNDDAGALSSWYVFASLGLYPVAGQDIYFLSSPAFPVSHLALGDGKTLTIRAPDVSATNRYVQSVTVNGRTWTKAWLRHADIAGGGEIRFVMGPEPSDWGTAEPPPSASETVSP